MSVYPYGLTHLLTNSVAALADVTVVTGMALVGFVNRSVHIISCLFPDFVFGNAPRMSIVINYSGPEAGNRRNCF